jgi:RNA polymerase sigma-70 factor (ECF subfamily)
MKLAFPLLAKDANPSEAMMRTEVRQRVRDALEQLPAVDREVLVMRHLEQMSVSEIAEALQITEGAVKMRRLRAIRRLKELL